MSETNKYNKSFIYKLVPKNPKISHIFYIGSTTCPLRRQVNHYYNWKNKHKKACPLYTFMGELGGYDNFSFVILKEVNCETRKELQQIEKEFILKYKPALNKNIPNRTKKEYIAENRERINFTNAECYRRHRCKNQLKRKERYAKNREKETQMAKIYYEKNKDKIEQKRRMKMTCMCGMTHQVSYRRKHLKTKGHCLKINEVLNNNLLFMKNKIICNS